MLMSAASFFFGGGGGGGGRGLNNLYHAMESGAAFSLFPRKRESVRNTLSCARIST